MRFFHSVASFAVASSLVIATPSAHAWGHNGHEMVNRLAAQYLPADVPYFLRNGNGVDVLEYLGPEPDRWHNNAERELRNAESPDHFIDMEYADLVGNFPRERYEFVLAAQKAAAEHPERKLTPGKIGFQPWAVEEAWQRLKVDLRIYRRLLAANADTAPVQVAILYDAGVLGHYVGDGSQPLHTTLQYNGWTGTNPHNYSVYKKGETGVHAQFESVYVAANITADDVAPLVAASKPAAISDEWTQYLEYLRHSNTFVEKLYEIDRAHGFDNAGTPEARSFTTERIAAGAIELRDLIYSAWTHSADPVEEYKGPQ